MASEVNVQNMGNLSEEREEAGSANVTLSPAWLHLCQGSPFFFHLQPIWGPLSLTRFLADSWAQIEVGMRLL